VALRVVEDAYAALDPRRRLHLRRLAGWWPLFADLCFSDLVLYLRAVPGGADFVMATHVRPVTSQTIYPTMIEGQVRTAEQRPLVAQAFDDGRIIDGEIDSAWLGEQIRVRSIPLRCDGDVVAVLTRESISSTRRAPGDLERAYAFVFDRLSEMAASGTLPFPDDEEELLDPPRVGDGVIVVDAGAVVTFASPNAVSALTRSGTETVAVGHTLAEVGLGSVGGAALAERRPVSAELEMPTDTVLSVRCIPLLGVDATVGAVVLVRDVTDIRRRDQLLVSKDATIREIHHRVKNNLQTISSLLRIQGRRLVEPSAREAIEESVRRIRAIALVHETLSRDVGEDVALGDVLRPLVRMVEEAMVSPDRPVRLRLTGTPGQVAAPVATSVAVVLNELLQNAVEHGFPLTESTSAVEGSVVLSVDNDGHRLHVEVLDDGVGIPAGVTPGAGSGLGLSIVETLVTTELGGTIVVGPGGHGAPREGTRVILEVPLDTASVTR